MELVLTVPQELTQILPIERYVFPIHRAATIGDKLLVISVSVKIAQGTLDQMPMVVNASVIHVNPIRFTLLVVSAGHVENTPRN